MSDDNNKATKKLLIAIYSLVCLMGIGVYLLATGGKSVPNQPITPQPQQLVPGTSKQLSLEDAIQLGVTQHQAGHLDKAEQIYRQILKMDPNNADVNHLLGLIAYQVGQFEPSIELIKKAIAINPNQPDYHSNLGNALQKSGKLEDAITSYRNALRQNERHVDALNNLGFTLYLSRKYNDAAACLQLAMSLSPNDSQIKNNFNNLMNEQPKTVSSRECPR